MEDEMKWLLIFLLTVSVTLAKESKMRVVSPAFENGGMIPAKYTCDDANISIPLVFVSVPHDAKSIAVVMDDPDAPVGIFVHWVIYDIPTQIEALPEGIPNVPELEYGIKQGINDFGEIGYGGPCPPPGHGPHRYFIKAYALDRVLYADPGLSKAELMELIEPFILDEAGLMGVYER